MPIGFGGVLFIVFLVLKLTNHIGWSYWWITAPLWIGAALTVLFLLVFGAGFAVFSRHASRSPSRAARARGLV